MARYATGQDMVDRFDAGIIGDLLDDDDRDRVPESEIIVDPPVGKMKAALDDASGRIDTALLAGARYTPSDLTKLTENSNAHLKRLTCTLALMNLMGRRPGTATQERDQASVEAETWLGYLADGKEVFELLPDDDRGHIEAGLLDQTTMTLTDVQRRNSISDRLQCHIFPVDDYPN